MRLRSVRAHSVRRVAACFVAVALSHCGAPSASPPVVDLRNTATQTIVLEKEGDPPTCRARVYDALGELMSDGALNRGRMDGEWTGFGSDGTKLIVWSLKDGVRDGQVRMWYGGLAQPGSASKLKWEGAFVDGALDGTVTRYYPSGLKHSVREYERGNIKSCESWSKDGTNVPAAAAIEGAKREHARDLEYFAIIEGIVTQTLERGRRVVDRELRFPNPGATMSELPTIDPSLHAREGTIEFRGHRVWYASIGDGEEQQGKLPLLCLHGGPGAAHDYLESLAAMAGRGRRVIFYDQLGCGNSDRPDDPSLWKVPLFVEEVGVVRRALGLNRVHLLGHSWGGMLAMEYALTRPDGVASLTIASSPASIKQWVAEANRLRAELPAEVQATLAHHEAAGTTDSSAYQTAMMEFYRRHVIRLDPMPEAVARTFTKLERSAQVYRTMNGPSEFHIVGNLKDWDIVARLPEIDLPTLVTSGKYDEATPQIAGTVHRGIRDSEWVVFENSSHMPHVEEADRYLTVLDEFLCRHDGSGR